MAPIRGTGIGKQVMQHVTQMSLGTEILYSFLIIVISLMIYFGTKELYNLTCYKGIQNFRLAFLFFAIAFFFRSFIKFLLIFFNIPRIFDFAPIVLGYISLFVFMYASAMAIFYLLYSVMWKKWNGNKIILFHILAIIIAIITLLVSNASIIIGIHLILFLFIAVVILISYKESKKKRKKNHLHGVYILLFIFWILNILDLLVPNFLATYQILIYLASISIFLAILYKVLRKLGA